MFCIVTIIVITQALMYASVYALGKWDWLILFKLSKSILNNCLRTLTLAFYRLLVNI